MAALRAEWFAQLADAIEGAQRLAWQLGSSDGTSMEARDLYSQLEAARLELDTIRELTSVREAQVEPNWLQMLGFNCAPPTDEAPA